MLTANIRASTIDELIPISREYFYFILLFGDPILVSCLLQPANAIFEKKMFS